jgi:hypothetical protein
MLPPEPPLHPNYRGDGCADQVIFRNPAGVLSALSNGGFVKAGDFIEFPGVDRQFRIESIDNRGAVWAIHFFNPPTSYSALVMGKANRNPIYESNDNSVASPLLSISGSRETSFRIYRQPTKSLAGSVALPRGACVDLAVSGVGPAESVVASPVGGPIHTRPFGSVLKHGALPTNPSPSAFNRTGIVFDAQGKLSYVLHERTNPSTGNLERVIDSVPSTLYLLIGRTEQVLSGYQPPTVAYSNSAYPVQLNNSYITSMQQQGGDGIPPSNLMDSENIWITCNPFTGEVRSAPVGAIAEDELAAMRAAAGGDNPALIERLMRHARRLAAAGMRN